MIGGDRTVLICLGPGGVGKTTIAAASAIVGALAGERVVVLTIDPAHRLADILGLASEPQSSRPFDGETPGAARPSGGETATAASGAAQPTDGETLGTAPRVHARGLGAGTALGNEPRLVAGPWAGELWAAMLDPAETLADLIRRHGGDEQADRVLANPLFATLAESLSGMNEYMAAERLHQLHNDARFDRVIIDTPPSRHAVDFLDSPQRLTKFIDNRFYRAVLAPRSGIIRSLNAAAQLVVRLAARLVGAELVDDVIRLFADLEGLDDGFRRRAVETTALLAGDRCAYALVTTARRDPIAEARWIADSLTRRSKRIETIVVNRLTPDGRMTRDDEPARPTGGRKADRAALESNLEQLGRLRDEESERIAELTGIADEPDDGGPDHGGPDHGGPDDDGPDVLMIEERATPLLTIDELVVLAGEMSDAAAVRPGSVG